MPRVAGERRDTFHDEGTALRGGRKPRLLGPIVTGWGAVLAMPCAAGERRDQASSVSRSGLAILCAAEAGVPLLSGAL